MTLDYLTIVDLLSLVSEAFSFPSLLASVLIGIICAFFGYFLFMKTLRVIVALEFGTIAYVAAVTLLPAGMDSIAGLPISLTALVGIAFAILGALIARHVYKLFVFATGAAFGAAFVPALAVGFVPSIAENQTLTYIAMALGALICAVIFTKVFRGLFILTTSLGGMAAVGSTIGIMLCPNTFLYVLKEVLYTSLIELGAAAYDVDQAFETVGLNVITAPASNMGMLIIGALTAIGFVVGIFAAVKQFKTDVD